MADAKSDTLNSFYLGSLRNMGRFTDGSARRSVTRINPHLAACE